MFFSSPAWSFGIPIAKGGYEGSQGLKEIYRQLARQLGLTLFVPLVRRVSVSSRLIIGFPLITSLFTVCRPSHSQCLPPPNQMGCHHLSPSQSIDLPPPPSDLVRLLYPIPSGCIRIYLLYLRHLHMLR